MEKCDIAVILTCFNRKKLTVASLGSVFQACTLYNENCDRQLSLSVFLTDDGCTDGTANAVLSEFPNEDIHIVQGTGSLYWAGGMRLAWKEALKDRRKWDFYLLINDDTILCDDAFVELFRTHQYVVERHHKAGLYCGTCSNFEGTAFIFGGKKYRKGLFGKAITVVPDGTPLPCFMTCANVLMVSSNVFEAVGMLDEYYTHTNADWAYGIEAGRHGFPVYVTGKVCGMCENDHPTEIMEGKKIISMTLSERKAFFAHPLRGTKDRLYFMWKYSKIRFFALFFARKLNIYFPRIYYRLIPYRPSES